MLTVTRLKKYPHIIEIKQTTFSYKRDKSQFFYKDTTTWDNLTNPAATKQEAPGKYRVPMGSNEIDWVKKYQIPLIKD